MSVIELGDLGNLVYLQDLLGRLEDINPGARCPCLYQFKQILPAPFSPNHQLPQPTAGVILYLPVPTLTEKSA
jgi:hypothetical protein